MREEITTHPLFEEPEFFPGGSTWQDVMGSPVKPFRGPGVPIWTLGRVYGELGVLSNNIYVYLGFIDNKTSVFKDEPIQISRIITLSEAYELALNSLEKVETKWDEYVKEEARYFAAFDDEEDDD